MFTLQKHWNPVNARLRTIIKKPEYFEETITLTLQLHSIVHFSYVSNSIENTYADEIFSGLLREQYAIMPTIKDETIAWCIWHIT